MNTKSHWPVSVHFPPHSSSLVNMLLPLILVRML